MARRNRNGKKKARLKLELTRHFREKWLSRFGCQATVAAVREIMETAALAQKGMQMQYTDGTPWKSLAIYIHFDRKVAIMVDEIQRTEDRGRRTEGGVARVVTFLTEEDQARRIDDCRLAIVDLRKGQGAKNGRNRGTEEEGLGVVL